jgi:long-chain acyl-CoA synthetase
LWLYEEGKQTMTPITALYRRADTHPFEVAFIDANGIWSYRQLATEADRLARAFLARGVRQGDRVALHMPNLAELVVAYYACFRIGAIAAPLNIRLKTAELRRILNHLRPSLYLGEAHLYSQVARIEPAILARDIRYVVGAAGEDDRAQPWSNLFADTDQRSSLHECDIDAPAVLLTTSGATGLPKFVTHTPATLSAATDACVRLGFAYKQTAINAVPIVHSSGLVTLLACVRFRAKMILCERFDADSVLDAIERHRCSWLLGMAFMFVELMRSQRVSERKVDSLRFCLSTGDVCPVQLQREFPDVFGVPLRSVWTSTETMAASLTYGLQPGPVSRIAPGAQVRLVDDDGASVRRGEVGELLVRGPSVTVGNWASAGQIDDPKRDGWFHTGDLMRRGKGDDLWFVSRKKELIIRGGSNISPVEVERVLMTNPAVRDAAVFGVPDPALGQRVAALVQMAEDGNGAALVDHILAGAKVQLADYKVPERVAIVGAIPRNALGKIDRKALPAMVSDTNAYGTASSLSRV